MNRILAANGVVWDLGETGALVRGLPPEASASVAAAMIELKKPQFDSARKLLTDAIDAYNARPQRSRDACANAFDAMEAVGKTVLDIPTGTFGDVVKELSRRGTLAPESVDMLLRLNIARNKHFGHGMTIPFALRSSEVDFVYLSCVAGVILLAREFAQHGVESAGRP